MMFRSIIFFNMEAQQFIKFIAKWFEVLFQDVKSRIDRGELTITGEYSFPDFLRVAESQHHYIIELTGATNIVDLAAYRIQQPKKTEKVGNVASLLNPGHKVEGVSSALINITGEDNVFMNLTFSTAFDQEKFERKINVSLNKSNIQADFDAKTLIFVSEDANKLVFRNIDLVRAEGFELFFKRISTAIVVKKTIGEAQLQHWLMEKSQEMMAQSKDILGINTSYSVSEEGFAVQLLSLTQQDVNENIIDCFIQANANFFAKALGYKSAISQEQLKIINNDGLRGDYLKPDFLMVREDGGCDILDLKKALIQPVTVGKNTRLRYSAYVAELIGQLSGYRRYFAAIENKNWVEQNLGIKVGDDFRLVGIVGNHNNFIREQVDLAHESYQDYITILSYSEVVNLLRKV